MLIVLKIAYMHVCHSLSYSKSKKSFNCMSSVLTLNPLLFQISIYSRRKSVDSEGPQPSTYSSYVTDFSHISDLN